MTNKELITKFYTAFQASDPDGMESCYHQDIRFEDPAFGQLSGADVMHMWRMLIHRGKGNIDIRFSEAQADDQTGHIHWEAIYPFSRTGNTVHNKIDATFQFRDNKIINHIDVFDLHTWSAMALGWKGKWFGGFGFFQNKIRKTAKQGLIKWKKNM